MSKLKHLFEQYNIKLDHLVSGYYVWFNVQKQCVNIEQIHLFETFGQKKSKPNHVFNKQCVNWCISLNRRTFSINTVCKLKPIKPMYVFTRTLSHSQICFRTFFLSSSVLYFINFVKECQMGARYNVYGYKCCFLISIRHIRIKVHYMYVFDFNFILEGFVEIILKR